MVPTLSDIPYARPSATVVLVRAATREPEIFMVRRHEKMSFGAAYAFPGGVVDPIDSATHNFCHGLSATDADSRLGVESNGLDYYLAAIRELFEETGVLLADISSVDENLGAVRDGLNKGSIKWPDFLARNELLLDCPRLHYFSHWITPPQRPARYSTRFFLAVLPQGQDPEHCGVELTESLWASANEMLIAGRSGDVDLHYPTVKTLESIARHKTLDELTSWAEACIEWGVTPMIPLIIERNGKQVIALPGEKDYPGAKS